MARPREWDREALREALQTYIDVTPVPIVAEFAYLHDIARQMLYDMPELADALKKCVCKKEAQLERLGLAGGVDKTMAIFSLKQLGWSDKTESTLKGDPNAPLNISTTDGKL